MSTYLLDTSIIIDAINNKRKRNQFLLDLTERQSHTLACCPINIAEVFAGMLPKEEQRTAALLNSLQLYQISFRVAELAGALKREYSKKGITLSLADTIIAAVAIDNRLTLITDNIKDFPMKELSLFQPPV